MVTLLLVFQKFMDNGQGGEVFLKCGYGYLFLEEIP
jgi:hypothetical protein